MQNSSICLLVCLKSYLIEYHVFLCYSYTLVNSLLAHRVQSSPLESSPLCCSHTDKSVRISNTKTIHCRVRKEFIVGRITTLYYEWARSSHEPLVVNVDRWSSVINDYHRPQMQAAQVVKRCKMYIYKIFRKYVNIHCIDIIF